MQPPEGQALWRSYYAALAAHQRQHASSVGMQTPASYVQALAPTPVDAGLGLSLHAQSPLQSYQLVQAHLPQRALYGNDAVAPLQPPRAHHFQNHHLPLPLQQPYQPAQFAPAPPPHSSPFPSYSSFQHSLQYGTSVFPQPAPAAGAVGAQPAPPTPGPSSAPFVPPPAEPVHVPAEAATGSGVVQALEALAEGIVTAPEVEDQRGSVEDVEKVDELEEDEESEVEVPLATVVAAAKGSFAAEARRSRPAFDTEVPPLHRDLECEWAIASDAPFLKQLVKNRKAVFKLQQSLYRQALEEQSYDLIAQKLAGYTRSKNSTFSPNGSLIRKYTSFCHSVDIPPWPLSLPVILLALVVTSRRVTKESGRAKELAILKNIGDTVGSIWREFPGVDQLQNFHGAGPAAKKWVKIEAAATLVKDVPQVGSSAALAPPARAVSLSPDSDDEEDLLPADDLLRRWAQERARKRAAAVSPSLRPPSPAAPAQEAALRPPSPQQQTPVTPVRPVELILDSDSEPEERTAPNPTPERATPSPPKRAMLFRPESTFGAEEEGDAKPLVLSPTPALVPPVPQLAQPDPAPLPEPAEAVPAPVDAAAEPAPAAQAAEAHAHLDEVPVGGALVDPPAAPAPPLYPAVPPFTLTLSLFLTNIAPRYHFVDHFLHLFVGVGVKTVISLADQRNELHLMLAEMKAEATVQGTKADERDWWALEDKLGDWFSTLGPLQ
ncbi:hypothetical protein JCM6882_003257 [Rhodosporidiobolus microsporus]